MLSYDGGRIPRPTVDYSGGQTGDAEHQFYALAQNKADRHMEPFVINVEYVAPEQPLSSHEGEEFVYVLEGPMEIRYGSETYTLERGEQHLLRFGRAALSHLDRSRTESQGARRRLYSVLTRWTS